MKMFNHHSPISFPLIADFGVSVRLNDTCSKRRSIVGSPYWMAPEYVYCSLLTVGRKTLIELPIMLE